MSTLKRKGIIQMGKIRIGMVGLGSMSYSLVEAIQKCRHMELYAICTRSVENLNAKAALWDVSKTYLNYNDMLNDPNVDAVFIVTPNKFHAPMTIAALKAGKHVFCEKPPAVTSQEAVEVSKVVAETGKKLMYGFMSRFSPKYQFVKELREKGMFGEIYYVKAGFIRRSGNPGGWFCDKSISGGGPLIDLGCHLIDLTIYLMGDCEPVSVFAKTFKRAENLDNIKEHSSYKSISAENYVNDVEDMALAVVNFNNGATLVLETSFASHIKDELKYLELLGTKGGISVDPVMEIHSTYENYLMDMIPRVECAKFDYQLAVDNEVAHFADCIMNNIDCSESVNDGVKVMKIIDAAYKSAATGEVVKV